MNLHLIQIGSNKKNVTNLLILQIYKGFLSIIFFLSCVKFLEIVLFIHLFLLFFGSFYVEESMMFGCRNGFLLLEKLNKRIHTRTV